MDETTLIMLAFGGAVAGALVLAHRYAQKQRKIMEDMAAAQGWKLSRAGEDTQSAAGKLNALLPEIQCWVTTVMTVEEGGRTILLADGSSRSRGGRSNSSMASFCLVESAALRAVGGRMGVCFRNPIVGAMLGDQVDMGSTPFARDYIVQSKDREAVWKFFDEPMQQAFLDHAAKPLYNPVEVTVDPRGITLQTGGIVHTERWLDLVEFARAIESCLARQGS